MAGVRETVMAPATIVYRGDAGTISFRKLDIYILIEVLPEVIDAAQQNVHRGHWADEGPVMKYSDLQLRGVRNRRVI
jgi:hypothetical protein